MSSAHEGERACSFSKRLSRLARLPGKRAVAALAALAALAAAPGEARGQHHPIGVLYSGVPAGDKPEPAPPPEPCTEDCYLLSTLVLRGSVSTSMTFELKGGVRANEQIKVPLFGPPGQVRLDDVTIDGAPAAIGFDGDRYHVFTSARSFTIRGRITVGSDQMLAVPGPVVAVDALLTSGRLIEGERLSGVTGAVLHFDPMTAGEAKPTAPPIFRLARALRFGRETGFSYKLTASQSTDLGTIRLPLRYGEKVSDVQGSTGWTVEGEELLLPTGGHEAEITIAGTLPPSSVGSLKTFSPDGRSAYEWWLVEADPEHRVEAGGEAKLVETSQSPIPPTFPGARVYLVQKGQALEVDARSLVRGDVLAAVARTHRRFVAITGRGELISDETISYDNNGLDHLMLTPAGKAMYLSTDQNAQRILHTEAGAKEVLVPVRGGTHQLRVQSLNEASLWPIAGAVTIPSTTHPLATSSAETTVGLPEFVRPIAVLGGDRVRWAFARGDLVAIVLGIALACFGFRTTKTRAIAGLCTAGLWFVSREGFVIATSGLFLAGAVFLASRFVRGTWLLVASGVLTVVALLGGRFALSSDATVEPAHEMFVERPDLPRPEAPGGSQPMFSGDPKTDITPVSLSFPTSERYVQASRQLVSSERPFTPRIVYVTNTFIAGLHAVWLALVALLFWAHKDRLLALKAKIAERLTRRPTTPDPTTAPEAPPF
ncbi:MAG: hypothetical protein KF795_20090 [Labilithrix sp.]|nr:hypothetical protein [Labilithrix sp.]